jgi:hypothetical protein
LVLVPGRLVALPVLPRRESVASEPVLRVDDPDGFDHHERTARRVVETAGAFDVVGVPADGLPVVLVVGIGRFDDARAAE